MWCFHKFLYRVTFVDIVGILHYWLCYCFEVLCLIIFAEELDEVQRHQHLLKELQKLAVDGTNKFTLTHFGVLLTQFSLLENVAGLIWHLFIFLGITLM